MPRIYDFTVKNAQNQDIPLTQYKGKWLLIVNTASQCGFTPQYEGLQKLYKSFNEKLEILAFPCNQFGQQEPGRDEEIQSFCQVMYHTEFPVMAKIDVKGKNADPLYQYLTQTKKGLLGSSRIKWNFTKFLVSPTGDIVKRYSPTTKPEQIQDELVDMLKVPPKTN